MDHLPMDESFSPGYVEHAQMHEEIYRRLVNVVDFGVRANGIADDAPALQAAFDDWGTYGGDLVFPRRAVCRINSNLLLPANCLHMMLMHGEGARILLGTNNAGFLKSTRSAAQDIFQHFLIEGFEIDCSLIDTLTNGIIQFGGDNQVNYHDITLRDIHIHDLATDPSGVKVTKGIVFYGAQAGLQSPQNYITDILLDHVRVDGGSWGFLITGNTNGAQPDILIDRVTVRDCSHDTGINYTASRSSDNLQIGERAHCGKIRVENFYGSGAGDTGVEINAASDAKITNCTVRNAFVAAFGTSPHNTAKDGLPCRITFDKCHAETNITVGNYGFIAAQMGGLVYNIDQLNLVDCSVSYTGAVIPTGSIAQALYIHTDGILNLLLDNFQVYINSTTTGSIFWTPITLAPKNAMNVTIRNYKLKTVITRVGVDSMAIRGIKLAGAGARYLVDGYDVDMENTNMPNGGTVGLFMGNEVSGDHIDAIIRSMRILRLTDTPAAARGISMDSANFTIDNELLIDGCDFRAIVSGTNVSLGSYVHARMINSIQTTDPAPASVSLTGSPFTYMNPLTDGYFLIAGGTVSKIEISTDEGGTFTDTLITAGMLRLKGTDQIRITYSSPPTVTKIPV